MNPESYLQELTNLDELKLQKLKTYYNLLIEKNKVMNLTTIVKEEDVYIKHFYDSLLAFKTIKDYQDKTLLDIGSGAGFPGIVLKICYPSLKVVLLEATSKKALFLQEVIDKLDLKDITVVSARAEDYIKDARSHFDFASARAVSSLNILVELALSYLKIGGTLIAMKGSNYQNELDESTNGIKILGGKVEEILLYDLPNNSGKRSIIKIKKVQNTPLIYPRTYAKIKQKPL